MEENCATGAFCLFDHYVCASQKCSTAHLSTFSSSSLGRWKSCSQTRSNRSKSILPTLLCGFDIIVLNSRRISFYIEVCAAKTTMKIKRKLFLGVRCANLAHYINWSRWCVESDWSLNCSIWAPGKFISEGYIHLQLTYCTLVQWNAVVWNIIAFQSRLKIIVM